MTEFRGLAWRLLELTCSTKKESEMAQEYQSAFSYSTLPLYRRISWGAVFAALAVTLSLQLLFGILGISFGAGSIDPLEERHPTHGIGLATGIWFVATSLIALFAGGWVAGRMSGNPRRLDAALHGAVGWGVSTLAVFYILTTTIGGAIAGAGGVLSKALGLAGQGVAQASGALVQKGAQALGVNPVDLEEIKGEIRGLMRDAAKPRTQAQRANGRELEALIDGLFGERATDGQKVDKPALVDALASRTDLTRAEAERVVDRWEATVNDAREAIHEAAVKAEQALRETGDKVAKATSQAAAWATVALVLGLLAAGAGGFLGAPRYPTVSAEQQVIVESTRGAA